MDLADLERDEVVDLLRLAQRLKDHPQPSALAGKVLGLLFLNPSLRTLASFQAAMSRLGGSSFVITPGQGSWNVESRNAVVMDGNAAEHVREAIPVLASYSDVLGIRAFAAGQNLADDLAETQLKLMSSLCDKPLVNLESAANHPCQALADWKTLDDLGVPRRGRFVLSWVNHPRALPLAVPAATVHMAAQRGMDVVVLRPEGYALPRRRDGAGAARRVGERRLGDRNQRAGYGAGRRAGAVCQGMGLAGSLRGRRRRSGAAPRSRRLVRDRTVVPLRAAGLSSHALPAGASQRRHRRPRARRTALARRGRRGQPHDGADGGPAPDARHQLTRLSRRMHAMMIGHKVEHAVTVRALRGAAPYIHMYKGKVFVIKTGGGAFREPATMRGFVEQVAILHHLGIRIVLVHGGGPQLDEVTARLGVQTRMIQGRRVTDDAAIDATSMVLNGLINTRLLGLCREFGISAIGLSGVDGGLVRAHRRPPVTLPNGEVVDYGMVGDIDTIDATVILRLLDAGFLPVVSPLSSDSTGQLLNINADTVAAAIGGALEAEKLILCTGAPGILERLEDPRSLISVYRSPGSAPPARGRCARRRDAAQGKRDRGGDPRRRAPCARHFLRGPRGAACRDLHQRRHRHARGGRRQGAFARRTGFGLRMTRLWDKGVPLDRRVLEFTAGEDHALDDRLVAYDVLASIAHAEALHGCGVLERRGPRCNTRRAA